jgi:hypothetical protein
MSSSAAAPTAGSRICAPPRDRRGAQVAPASARPGRARVGLVKRQAEAEGLDRIFIEAGFEWREPGCSMCLAMNPDGCRPASAAPPPPTAISSAARARGAHPLDVAGHGRRRRDHRHLADVRELGLMSAAFASVGGGPSRSAAPISTPTSSFPPTSQDDLAEGLGRTPSRRSARARQRLRRPEFAGAPILIAGANFGCGSSREHAVWALCDLGIQAVIAPSFSGHLRRQRLSQTASSRSCCHPRRSTACSLSRVRAGS